MTPRLVPGDLITVDVRDQLAYMNARVDSSSERIRTFDEHAGYIEQRALGIVIAVFPTVIVDNSEWGWATFTVWPTTIGWSYARYMRKVSETDETHVPC